MLRFATTAILTFTTRPLYIGIWVGTARALFAFVELAFVLIQYPRGVTVPGWASLVGVSSLLFGFLFLLLGVIGLYVARIHVALQMPPLYVVAEETRLKGAAAARDDRRPLPNLPSAAGVKPAAGSLLSNLRQGLPDPVFPLRATR